MSNTTDTMSAIRAAANNVRAIAASARADIRAVDPDRSDDAYRVPAIRVIARMHVDAGPDVAAIDAAVDAEPLNDAIDRAVDAAAAMIGAGTGDRRTARVAIAADMIGALTDAMDAADDVVTPVVPDDVRAAAEIVIGVCERGGAAMRAAVTPPSAVINARTAAARVIVDMVAARDRWVDTADAWDAPDDRGDAAHAAVLSMSDAIGAAARTIVTIDGGDTRANVVAAAHATAAAIADAADAIESAIR